MIRPGLKPGKFIWHIQLHFSRIPKSVLRMPTFKSCRRFTVTVATAAMACLSFAGQGGDEVQKVDLVSKGKHTLNGYDISAVVFRQRPHSIEQDMVVYFGRLGSRDLRVLEELAYKGISVKAFDEYGDLLAIRRDSPNEVHMDGVRSMGYWQFIGSYVVGDPKGRKPAVVEVSWKGEKSALRFVKGKPQESPSR